GGRGHRGDLPVTGLAVAAQRGTPRGWHPGQRGPGAPDRGRGTLRDPGAHRRGRVRGEPLRRRAGTVRAGGARRGVRRLPHPAGVPDDRLIRGRGVPRAPLGLPEGVDMFRLSRESERVGGVLLLSIVAVEFGGYYLTRAARGDVELTEVPCASSRAGHAHAGVLVTLSLVALGLALLRGNRSRVDG